MLPETYLSRYDPQTITLRANCKNADRSATAGYYAHITALDEQVGRLMKGLERLGLHDRTLVVFTSDHGDMLWSHGRVKKQQPWEESIRVPLILHAPGLLPRNRRLDLLIGTVDLAPTLLGLLGAPFPSTMEGLDLSARLAGKPGEEHRSVLIMDMVPADQAKRWNGRPWRGIRTKRYTFARWRDRGWVLYDNQADPLQQHNLIDDPASAKLRNEMEKELEQWLSRTHDPFLSAEDQLETLGLLEAWRERERHFASGKNW